MQQTCVVRRFSDHASGSRYREVPTMYVYMYICIYRLRYTVHLPYLMFVCGCFWAFEFQIIATD